MKHESLQGEWHGKSKNVPQGTAGEAGEMAVLEVAGQAVAEIQGYVEIHKYLAALKLLVHRFWGLGSSCLGKKFRC